MPLSPDTPDHSPLDFQPFGLRDWSGAKWVEFYEGEVGKPIWSMWLAHAIGDELVIVKTAPKARWDQVMVGASPGTTPRTGAGADQFAVGAVRTLVDSARPHLVDYERRRYNRGIVPFSDALGSEWRNGDPVTWRLNGRKVKARIFRFVHAWTAVTIDDPERYVGVAAYRTDERSLDLVEVTGHDYGWDFARPFSLGDLNDQPNRPDTEAIVRASLVHPDHLRVIDCARGESP